MPTSVSFDPAQFSTLAVVVAQDTTGVPSLDGGGQALSDPGTGPAAGRPTGSPFGGGMIWIIVLMMAFLIFTTISSSRREKKRVNQMLSGLKRGDRVQTAGGLIGTVDQVKESEVVLRIDEVGGTKAHFAKTAVQHVLRAAKSGTKGEDSSEDQ